MCKENIIFLDIDGVLNSMNIHKFLLWKIFSSIGLSQWIEHKLNVDLVDKKAVKRLNRIIQATDAKIVLTASCRGVYVNTEERMKHRLTRRLHELFVKYGIEVKDVTPASINNVRGNEILSWLSKHEDEINQFIILDDEKSDMTVFEDDFRLIQTRSKSISGIDNTGIKNIHVRRAIKILNTTVMK